MLQRTSSHVLQGEKVKSVQVRQKGLKDTFLFFPLLILTSHVVILFLFLSSNICSNPLTKFVSSGRGVSLGARSS